MKKSKSTVGEQAETALRVVREVKSIAFDTETSGVDWKRNKPVGYVITSKDFNTYIPIRHGGGQNLLGGTPMETPEDKIVIHKFEHDLAKAFKERDRLGYATIGHNLKFDYHFSLTAGIALNRRMYCTQINAALLDEFARSYSLAACCEDAGVTAKKGDELYKHLAAKFGGEPKPDQMANFWRLPGHDPIAVDYAMGDGTSTLELFEWQVAKVKEEELEQVARVEHGLQRHIADMERLGIKIDEEQLAKVQRGVAEVIAKLEAQLPDSFNVKSPVDVRKYMEDHGVTNWPTTAKGAPSMNEKWLKGSEPGRRIVEVRKMKTLMSSFIEPMATEHMFNGRVHTTLHQLKSDEFGVIAGRFSSSGPNLQQVSKHNFEVGSLHRSIFVADEGMEMFEADWSQAEPRLFAHYSEEPTLIEGYNSDPPVDMHAVTAQAFDADRETTAKRMNMGMLTGMFPEALAGHMGWDLDKATYMWNKYFEVYPRIRSFQNGAKNVMKDRGFVKTLLGRRCRMDHPRFAYRAVSRIIQGGNADILKYKLLQMAEFIESEKNQTQLLLTVHDSYVGQAFDRRHADPVMKIMNDVRGEPFNLKVPYKADVKWGKSWAICTYGDKLNVKAEGSEGKAGLRGAGKGKASKPGKGKAGTDGRNRKGSANAKADARSGAKNRAGHA